ncbi:hypothetical protein E3N88_12201 [Mikania micrantha]|uniref:Ubiquitin-like protease family profile domain-containing protein n=1 Tax=Mikania micrantha TaxID=192012 RepID=A0A5N6P553_9ASTR|nr:hypothetical protein E3N88_12201 [Mikania micrantha]
MRPDHYIHLNVILAWSQILNYEEKYKSKDSISRLFCTHLLLNRDTYEKSVEEMNIELNRNMEVVLGEVNHPIISGFELVFVPIINQQHFYIMCFNLKTPKVEIINNSGVMPRMSVTKKYSGWPDKMKKTFADYLIQKQHPNGRHISTAKIHLRHMETYKGCLLDWECGLRREDEVNNLQKLQLNDLRKKYTTKIILHDLNERFDWVTKDLMRHMRLPVEVRREANRNAHGNIASRLLENANQKSDCLMFKHHIMNF